MTARPDFPHVSVAYDLCDVLDRIARTGPTGRHWAEAIPAAAIAMASAYFPAATVKELGADLVASYKARADRLPPAMRAKAAPADVIDQAIERLRTAATTAAQQQGDQAIADLIDRLTAALTPSSSGRVTLTDAGRQSALPTTKAARSFSLAAAARGEYGDPIGELAPPLPPVRTETERRRS